ncbi:MAG: polysulfide reductase NrfD [Candidatus Latescibacterota bacterium]|nr:MAG: polysulfide reductase NrfD [Candidatus Latescibacterota bacterium]
MDVKFKPIDGNTPRYWTLVGILAVLALAGAWSTWLMFKQGIYLSGMTNRVPWGLQIVMAIYYIGLSAGSLVVSGLYGIFGKAEYKPFARMAAYLAMLFLIAGLLSIITDQGRTDRVFIEPFSHANPWSMFSINPSLYIGHITICIIYLWALFNEKYRLTKVASVTVVAWAIAVHSGTGAIFAFTPRELYTSPLLPVAFVAAALSSGAALMILVITALFKITKRHLDLGLIVWLGRLLAVFIVVALYVIMIENLHRFYLIESRHAAMYYLFGGWHAFLFWGGLILVGSIVPALILFKTKTGTSLRWILFASVLVVVGVWCERYMIVIPGQTFPPELFPGMEIVRSPLNEGIAVYNISFLEVLQALGVLGVIGCMFVLGLKYLPLAPAEARTVGESQMLKHMMPDAEVTEAAVSAEN